MINIDPTDFASDAIYTKIEELRGKKGSLVPILEGITKDIVAVEKYLKLLNLTKKEYLYDIGDAQDEDGFQFGWDNEKKRLVASIIDIRNYCQEYRNLIECKIAIRLACHSKLPKLIDMIIKDVGENNE